MKIYPKKGLKTLGFLALTIITFLVYSFIWTSIIDGSDYQKTKPIEDTLFLIGFAILFLPVAALINYYFDGSPQSRQVESFLMTIGTAIVAIAILFTGAGVIFLAGFILFAGISSFFKS